MRGQPLLSPCWRLAIEHAAGTGPADTAHAARKITKKTTAAYYHVPESPQLLAHWSCVWSDLNPCFRMRAHTRGARKGAAPRGDVPSRRGQRPLPEAREWVTGRQGVGKPMPKIQPSCLCFCCARFACIEVVFPVLLWAKIFCIGEPAPTALERERDCKGSLRKSHMPLAHVLIHEPRHMKSASSSMSATNIVYLMGHMDLWHGSCGETAPQWLPRCWLFRRRVACSLRPLSSKP